jgi:hypothetical protein
VLTNKIRIRKNTYELISELIYRLEMILLNKKQEFGEINTQTRKSLSELLTCLRASKTTIITNCVNQEDFTTRSKELNAVIDAIEMLKEEKVLVVG